MRCSRTRKAARDGTNRNHCASPTEAGDYLIRAPDAKAPSDPTSVVITCEHGRQHTQAARRAGGRATDGALSRARREKPGDASFPGSPRPRASVDDPRGWADAGRNDVAGAPRVRGLSPALMKNVPPDDAYPPPPPSWPNAWTAAGRPSKAPAPPSMAPSSAGPPPDRGRSHPPWSQVPPASGLGGRRPVPSRRQRDVRRRPASYPGVSWFTGDAGDIHCPRWTHRISRSIPLLS